MRRCLTRFRFTALFVIVAANASVTTAGASAAHLCLAPPSAQMPGVSNEAAIAAVRNAFKNYLAGPSLDVEALSARLTSQARAPAAIRPSGASQVAANAGSSGTRVLASAAAGGAANTYYSSFTQSSDKLTLTARLEAVEGSVLTQSSDTRKARSDGEGLLSPLVERAAAQVVNAVSGVAS
jgi:hypothetical protein